VAAAEETGGDDAPWVEKACVGAPLTEETGGVDAAPCRDAGGDRVIGCGLKRDVGTAADAETEFYLFYIKNTNNAQFTKSEVWSERTQMTPTIFDPLLQLSDTFKCK
jgi:hypothetical protein